MKRFHVHVAVRNLEESIRFYSALLGAAPSVIKTDYAKWMLDDPRINLAISSRGAIPGVNHLGLQVDTTDELAAIEEQLRAGDLALHTESDIGCCYARSDKHWVTDPQGVAWEAYHTLGEIPVFGTPREDSSAPATATATRCCAA